jgi:hypothetical protein
MHAEIYALVTPKGYVIRYKIPEITTSLEVIELRTLPSPIRSNMFGKVKLRITWYPLVRKDIASYTTQVHV